MITHLVFLIMTVFYSYPRLSQKRCDFQGLGRLEIESSVVMFQSPFTVIFCSNQGL